MTGILLGAALTGLALQLASWQQVFLVALPLGFGALTAAWLMPRVPNSPSTKAFRVDRYETATLICSLLAFGVFINLGDNLGWFRSRLITAAFVVFVVSVPLYVTRARRLSYNLLDTSVLRNVPFTTAALLTFGAAFFSTGQFQIDMLGGPLHMSPEVLSLRSGLGAAALLAGVVLGGLLLQKLKADSLIVSAFVIVLVGKYAFTRYGVDLTTTGAIWPQVVTGFGLGLLTTPLAVSAYRTLPATTTKDAASLFSMATQLGSGLGIALLGIVLSYLQESVSSLVRGSPFASLLPFLEIFWIELVGTALLLLATLVTFYALRKRD